MGGIGVSQWHHTIVTTTSNLVKWITSLPIGNIRTSEPPLFVLSFILTYLLLKSFST